jgi:hypothetical protein
LIGGFVYGIFGLPYSLGHPIEWKQYLFKAQREKQPGTGLLFVLDRSSFVFSQTLFYVAFKDLKNIEPVLEALYLAYLLTTDI